MNGVYRDRRMTAVLTLLLKRVRGAAADSGHHLLHHHRLLHHRHHHLHRHQRLLSGLSPLRDQPLIVGSSRDLVQRLGSQVDVRTGFITEEEEEVFLSELEPDLRRKRYEFDHWDDAIHGYRETERSKWGAACEEVLNRVRSVAFPEGSPLLGPVHVLDLDQTGYIKPHIDSVKFCGSTIAGLSLLSDSIMRLVKEDAANEWLDLLLPRRSLYILRDQARFNFTHQILKDEESVFSGQRVPRLRRISVICRNLPG